MRMAVVVGGQKDKSTNFMKDHQTAIFSADRINYMPDESKLKPQKGSKIQAAKAET